MAELAAECRGLHLPYDENIAAQRLAAVRSARAKLIGASSDPSPVDPGNRLPAAGCSGPAR